MIRWEAGEGPPAGIRDGDMTGGVPEGHGPGRAGGGGGGGSEPARNKDGRGGLPGWREGPSSEPPRRGSRPAAPTASPPPPCGSAGRRRLPAPGDAPRTRGPTVPAGPRAHSPGPLGSFLPPGPLAPPESPSQLPGLAAPSAPQARAPRAPGPPHSGRFSVTPSQSRHPILLCPCMPLPEFPHAGPVPPAPGPTPSGSPARPGGKGVVTSS